MHEKGSAMTDHITQSLTDHLQAKEALGLVDIKFYVNRLQGVPEPHVVCEEVECLFDAIKAGYTEAFRFDDTMVAAA